MSNYLKTFGPVALTLLTVGYTVWGNLPWYAPVAAGISASLTYLLKNTPPVKGTLTVTKKPDDEYKPESTAGQDGLGLMGIHGTVPATAPSAAPAPSSDPEVTKLKAQFTTLRARVTALEKKILGKA